MWDHGQNTKPSFLVYQHGTAIHTRGEPWRHQTEDTDLLYLTRDHNLNQKYARSYACGDSYNLHCLGFTRRLSLM